MSVDRAKSRAARARLGAPSWPDFRRGRKKLNLLGVGNTRTKSRPGCIGSRVGPRFPGARVGICPPYARHALRRQRYRSVRMSGSGAELCGGPLMRLAVHPWTATLHITCTQVPNLAGRHCMTEL